MNRRDFFRKSLATGIAAGTALSLGDLDKLIAGGAPPSSLSGPPPPYDLVAVKGTDPVKMLDAGMESIGGMGAFVKKGQTVVVKPNIGWDVPPDRAGNTNPDLVRRIIQLCFIAGAKQVYVFDNTCDNWIKCYQNSGIEKAVKDANGKIVPGNSEGNYQEVEVKNGKKLKKAKVHELILSSDVFINAPILKSHSSTQVTISMKNLMGIVWDRYYWHKNDLNQCIVDFIPVRKPDLNIVDAYRVLMKRGPRGVSVEDVEMKDSLIISKDIVAADAASAKIFGIEPATIAHIKMAAEANLGVMDLTKLNINRIKLS
jgi:uncharacterized protein (DUF362 family)